MSQRILTDEQVAEAQRLRATGLSYAKIAVALGNVVSGPTVQYALCPEFRAKMAEVSIGRRRENMDPQAYAMMVNRRRERTIAQNALDKATRNRPLEPEQIALATEMRMKQGLSYGDIALALGGDDITPNRVRISLDPANRNIPQSVQRQKYQLQIAIRAEEREAKRMAERQAERDRRELDKETTEREADAASPATNEAEERERIGVKLFAINRAARSKLIDGG